MYCRGLTREQLKEMGITNIDWDRDTNEWWINRYWYYRKHSGKKVHQHLTISQATVKHKYGTDKTYPKIQLSYCNKQYAFPLSRVIYAWFVKDIPDGYVIDHIDNNPFNNEVDNLEMMTIEENLRKRYTDNNKVCFNQYKNRLK